MITSKSIFQKIFFITMVLIASWTLVWIPNYLYFIHTGKKIGQTRLQHTHLGSRCGTSTYQKNPLIWYHITKTNKLVYMCPNRLWPINKKVVDHV